MAQPVQTGQSFQH